MEVAGGSKLQNPKRILELITFPDVVIIYPDKDNLREEVISRVQSRVRESNKSMRQLVILHLYLRSRGKQMLSSPFLYNSEF